MGFLHWDSEGYFSTLGSVRLPDVVPLGPANGRDALKVGLTEGNEIRQDTLKLNLDLTPTSYDQACLCDLCGSARDFVFTEGFLHWDSEGYFYVLGSVRLPQQNTAAIHRPR